MKPSKDQADRRALEERVMAEYDRFMHRLALSHAPEFAEVGLTMSQAKILYLVQSAGGLRMSELVTRLGVTVSTTSVQVDRLAAQGLLTRTDDPADRRHVVLALTRAGNELLERMRELNAAHMRRMLARVSHDDLATIERSIHILADAAEAAAPAASQAPVKTPAAPRKGSA